MAFEHEGQHKVIRIVLTEEPSNPVTIDISIGTLSRGLSEYGYPGHYWDNTALTASPSRLTFNSNNWDTQQPVTITSMVNDYDHPAQAILVLTPSENLRSDGSSSVPGIHVKVANGAVCTTCATAGPPGAVGPPQKESPQLPVITLKGDNYVTIPFGSAWTDPGYTATDSDGNDITGDVTVFGGVDTSQEGIHIIVYTVMSISGGVAQEIRTVTVEAPPLLNPEPQVNTQPATQAETQIAEQTYCRDMSIDQLVATGDYNVMDNRNGTYGDTIKGTAGADLIIASDSGNKIFGKKGDDCIIGGAGADVIRGQQGNDWIMGLAGVDNLRGGAGHDLLFGGDGDDTILGKAGDDVMVCGAGTDKARGGAGHDIAESCEDVQAEYATPGG